MTIFAPLIIQQETFKILCHKPFMVSFLTLSTSNRTIYITLYGWLFQYLCYLFFITIRQPYKKFQEILFISCISFDKGF